MRISDWSSDVCSSDLVPQVDAGADRHRGERGPADGVACGPAQGARDEVAEQVGKQADRERQRARLQCPQPAGVQRKVHSPGTTLQIGSASWRERVCPSSVSFGGRRILKKKNKTPQTIP